jgi:hypothetical protein
MKSRLEYKNMLRRVCNARHTVDQIADEDEGFPVQIMMLAHQIEISLVDLAVMLEDESLRAPIQPDEAQERRVKSRQQADATRRKNGKSREWTGAEIKRATALRAEGKEWREVAEALGTMRSAEAVAIRVLQYLKTAS